MYKLTCIRCGKRFISSNPAQSFCSVNCKHEPVATSKKKEQPNQLLIDTVAEADALGLTYGQYMYKKYKEGK